MDFGAVLALGAAMGAPLDFLADMLPEIEPMIVAAWKVEE